MARPRKPTHLKLVTGTAKKCRTNPSEPMLPVGMPSRPSCVSGNLARAAWVSFGRTLFGMGVLAGADGAALGRLAMVYAEVQELTREIENHGRVYQTRGASGEPMFRARPEVAMLADADRRLMILLNSFGLTPSSRSKVSAVPQVEKTGADGFFD